VEQAKAPEGLSQDLVKKPPPLRREHFLLKGLGGLKAEDIAGHELEGTLAEGIELSDAEPKGLFPSKDFPDSWGGDETVWRGRAFCVQAKGLHGDGPLDLAKEGAPCLLEKPQTPREDRDSPRRCREGLPR
jgi:hypothetical protein